MLTLGTHTLAPLKLTEASLWTPKYILKLQFFDVQASSARLESWMWEYHMSFLIAPV